MSKSQRFFTPNVRQPGPGEYDMPSKIVEGPRFTTRPKPAIPDFFKLKKMPGPGQHDPPAAPFKNIKYSMSGVNDKNQPATPGPGSYEDMR